MGTKNECLVQNLSEDFSRRICKVDYKNKRGPDNWYCRNSWNMLLAPLES